MAPAGEKAAPAVIRAGRRRVWRAENPLLAWWWLSLPVTAVSGVMNKLSYGTAAQQPPGRHQLARSALSRAAQPGRDARSAGLGGTGLVADDLYLMAHHEVSGRPWLQPRALGIGLAGGLLAELMLAGGISWRGDGAVAAGPVLPADALARRVRDQIAGEGEPRPAREWLLVVARTAAVEVAGRLERSGYLARDRARWPWRSGRWVPADPDWAFSPLLRVRAALDPARPWSAHGAVLAGLAAGCGLGFRLAQYPPGPGCDPDQTAARLDPGLRELIAQTQAAVDSAVLSHRA
jgi:hypothetical protein